MRIPKRVKNILISIVVMVLIFMIAGVVYVYLSGGQTPKATTAKKPSTESTPNILKPVQPSVNATEGVAIENLVSPVKAGDNTSVQIHTNATSNCTIAVTYNGVPSKDSGLAPKTADVYGFITWTWTVEPTVPAGSYPINVTCTYHGRSGVVIGNLQVTN